jgi:hypothetical protein
METRIIIGLIFFVAVFVIWRIVKAWLFPEPTYHRTGSAWETNYSGEGKITRQMVVNNHDPEDIQEITE